MKTADRLASLFFRAVCLGFSAFLLVLALLGQIRLVALNSRVEALEAALREAEDANTVLKTRLAASLSLSELERIAVQELGMQHPEPGQISVIESAG